MKNGTKRAMSLLMALVLSLGLLSGMVQPAQAATVNYTYDGNYVYNWGSRGTTATFLSPMAEEFYADNNVSYGTLSSYAGSSSVTSVPASPLYGQLQELMTSNHSYKTSYDATKSLYQYTDCQNGGGKISSFYSGNAIGPAWGQGGWNREHTWPNSKGLGGSDENDIMMLRPTSTSENSSRGNTAYGQSSGYYDPNKLGQSLHGDVARIILYQYVRWGNTSRMWGQNGVMESKEVLLQWMEEDPVDTWELGRNDAVEAITGTRNVFVDYPELAFLLFGEAVPANYTTPSGSEAGVSYTITATSADPAKGTVSVTGRTITATPASGYEASGYTVVSGTATVNQSGNRFTVQPTSDVTVQIHFAEKIPMPTVSQLQTGDQVVIYAPAYNKALSSQIVATHYLMGADVTEESGALVGYTATETWTVTANSDGTYSFANGGKTLGMAADYASMRPGETNDKWQLVGLGGSLYNVKNTVRGNYMEWYASKDNWSTYSDATDSQFQLSFYVLGKGLLTGQGDAPVLPPVEPDQPDQVATATKLTALPQNGDVVVVYNEKNLKAMGAMPSGTRIAGVNATIEGDTLSVSQEMALLTVEVEGEYYIFTMGGKYLTSGDTGNALSFESQLTDCGRWTMESAGSGIWYIKNVGAAYNNQHNQALEYYYQFTTYGFKEDPIYQMQLYKVDTQPEPPAPVEKLTAPVVKKDGQKLTWNEVENADAYEIYRATSKKGKYTCVANQPMTSYEDVSVAAKTYYYKVKAVYEVDETKNSGYSNVVSLARKCDTPVVDIEEGSSGKPVISWEKVVGAKKYTVYRASSETGKYSKLGTTTKLSYTDKKASTGKTWYYKVVANASSSKYNSGYSNIVSYAVICTTPKVSFKIDVATGKPVLSWKKVDCAAGYRIFRQLPGEEMELIAEQKTTSFKDTTAPVDTQCIYQVQTVGRATELDSLLSKAAVVVTSIARPKAKGSYNENGKPVLTWDAVEGALWYEVYRSTKSSKGYVLLETLENATAYTDETVATGKTYYYKVAAVGEITEGTVSSYVKLTGKCATPEVSVETANSGKPKLSWEKVSGAKKYTVYRATSEGGKYKKLGTTTKLSYTDSKASVGKTYYYKIVANASSSKNNSPYSNIVSCSAICATPVVKIKTNASGQPVLSWSKVSGAQKYEIYLLGADDYVTLGTVTGTTWTDADCAVGEGRYYGVRAIATEEAYNSEVSAPVFGRATCAAPKPTGKVGDNKKPVISWNEIEGAVKYEIYRSTSKSKGYKLLGESETLSYEDLTAKKSKTYYYKVVAVGENCESAQSAYVKVKSK